MKKKTPKFGGMEGDKMKEKRAFCPLNSFANCYAGKEVKGDECCLSCYEDCTQKEWCSSRCGEAVEIVEGHGRTSPSLSFLVVV